MLRKEVKQMTKFKLVKALVLLLAFMVLFLGGFSITSASKVEAAKCCWVHVCTVNPPIICWDECRPCPRL